MENVIIKKEHYLVTTLDLIDKYSAGWFGTWDEKKGPVEWHVNCNWLIFPQTQERELVQLKQSLCSKSVHFKPVLISVEYKSEMKMMLLPSEPSKIDDFAQKIIDFMSSDPYNGESDFDEENYEENFNKTFFSG